MDRRCVVDSAALRDEAGFGAEIAVRTKLPFFRRVDIVQGVCICGSVIIASIAYEKV